MEARSEIICQSGSAAIRCDVPGDPPNPRGKPPKPSLVEECAELDREAQEELEALHDSSDTAKKHYYRVFVGGYVFPQLPPGSTDEQIRMAVEKCVWEDGDLDITRMTVETEFDA